MTETLHFRAAMYGRGTDEDEYLLPVDAMSNLASLCVDRQIYHQILPLGTSITLLRRPSSATRVVTISTRGADV
jgi:hypothetical protein